MSHFVVMVVGEDPGEQLAPFHEYESTCVLDEYVKMVDRTESAREAYEKYTVPVILTPDGKQYDKYDIRFWRLPTEEDIAKYGDMLFGHGHAGDISWCSQDWGMGRETRILDIPTDCTEQRVPYKDNHTFKEYLLDDNYTQIPHDIDIEDEEFTDGDDYVDKCRFFTTDAEDNVDKVYVRTNPNAKWDWYTIGGRWASCFKYKNPTDDMQPDVTKAEYDFEAMANVDVIEENAQWDRAEAIIKGRKWESWESVRERFCGDEDHFDGSQIDAARDFYHNQPVLKEVKQDKAFEYSRNVDRFVTSARTAEIARVRLMVNPAYAVVQDSKWHAQGDMGWWGVSNDTMSDIEWHMKLNELVDSLPDDTKLTFVDCHI